MSLREGKPRCALLCCSLALSPPPPSQEHGQQQQQTSSSLHASPSSSSALPAAIRASATYNAALASLAIEGDEGKESTEQQAAEELEALARSLDGDSAEGEGGGGKTAAASAATAAAARPFVLDRRARARVWLRAAESLVRVAAAGGNEGGEEEGEKLWGRASAAASRAAALACAPPSSSCSAAAASGGDAGDPSSGADPRCRAAALALVAASEVRLGRFPRAREAIRQALSDPDPDLGGGGGFEKGRKDPLLPGARAALESYLRVIGS